ncbi:MAG: hypothetical protein HYS27_17300 [Deltaproteobacteria bacterium]|nr:hypothetical protein [Deltaproteobacteria bacterium]
MSTFGAYSLVRAVPSYGGAEVVRARRWRAGRFEGAVHLALYGPAKIEQRLIASAEALAAARHDRVARIHEVGRCEGSLYAVADPLEGLDVRSLLEHDRSRRAAPDVALAVAVALALARTAAELLDKDVWAGARGAGISSLFAAGLRLDALVLQRGGVSLRPLAGAADDPSAPTPFRAPEIGARYAPANAATDVFLIAQVLRALCAGDASAAAAPRLGRSGAALAPILADGLAAVPDERPGLDLLIDRLARALHDVAGDRSPAELIDAATAGERKVAIPPPAPDPEPSQDDARAAEVAQEAWIAWPPEADDDVRTARSLPAFALRSSGSDHEAVDRVFTDEGTAAPEVARAEHGRVEIGRVREMADDTTQKLPMPPSRASSSRPSTSDPPWASAKDVLPVEDSKKRPAAAPPPVASEVEAGPTVEMRSPFDEDKTE